MSRKNILMIADPGLPVPPVTYGGIERIVAMLAEGLAGHGWDVTLACHPESTCAVERVPLRHPSIRAGARLRNALAILTHKPGRFDLIHSFAHFDMLAALWPLSFPKVQSFQSFPPWDAFQKRLRVIPRRNFHITVCGKHMVPRFDGIAPCVAIHNGVVPDSFDFIETAADDAPLVFLGRIEPIKGTHHAIHVARVTGRRLVVAGNISETAEAKSYFEQQIAPFLSDRIEYIGPVDDVRKNRLLGGAAAMLMPIEWDEPFGIVMAESLACGTPVIGFARGALPEIVDHGITGFHATTVEDLVDGVGKLGYIARRACRDAVECRFSAKGIIKQYSDFYSSLLRRP
jgi:glycosyltransferase involved in cell wall biosynthesis